MPIFRWTATTPFAALTTVGLFALMIGLIDAEFEAQSTAEVASFDINPTIDDLETVMVRERPDTLDVVDTPPPPPAMTVQKASLPTTPIADLIGEPLPFERPVIDPGDFEIVESNTDAQPLVRIPPIMPPRASRSGHCWVAFDVSPEGQPFDVRATDCSDSVFSAPTVKSVQKWQYKPKVRNGVRVARSGMRTKVVFQLTDERGRVIPE